MSDATCNACRFWEPRIAASGLGECRRYPPSPAFELQGRPGRVSPWTGAYFWCGEHQLRADGIRIATGQDAHAEELRAARGLRDGSAS